MTTLPLRTSFYALSTLLWIGVVLLVAELGLRVVSSERVSFMSYLSVLDKAKAINREAIDQARAAGLDRPNFADPDRPDYRALPEVAPTDRRDFAAAREEVVFLCSRDGTIHERYIPTGLPKLDPIVDWLRRHDSLAAALPEAEAADALGFIQQVLDQDFYGPREYSLPQEDKQPYPAEFWFQRLVVDDGATPRVAVHVRPSVYAEVWSRYRPHIYRKNYFLQFPESEFWTNAHGCRDEEVVLPKPEGTFRIVCIGGSTTVEGPYNTLTYPNMLERKLRAHFDQPIEVVNCGVENLHSPDELANLPHYLQLEPDLILHYNFANDAREVFSRALDASGSSAGNANTWPGWLVRMRVLAYLLPWARGLLLPDQQSLLTALDIEVFDNHRAIKRRTEAAGVDYAICSYAAPQVSWWNIPLRARLDHFFKGWTIPDYGVYRHLVELYNVRLRRFCEVTDTLYVPVGEHLRAGLATFSDHCHLHVHGIEAKADLVFEGLENYIADKLAAA